MISILIDATACKPGQSGILSHGLGLARELAACDEYRVHVASSALSEFGAIPDVRVIPAPSTCASFVRRASWREVHLRRLVRQSGAHIVVSTAPELPFRPLHVPSIMVVHDVGAVVAPALYSRAKRLRYEAVLPFALRRASHVVCVSEATLLDLHRWAGISASRCSVIGNVPQPLELDPPLEQQHGSTGRHAALPPATYFLLVGNLFGNKNTETVLRAMAILAERLPAGTPAPRLVLAGPASHSDQARLWATARALNITELLTHRGFVSVSALAHLYRDAAALIYPSLYEGQGIPVMEAQMCGVPVIATDLPSIREFGFSPHLSLVPRPLDPSSWADAMARIPERLQTGAATSLEFRWSNVGPSYRRLVERILWEQS